MLARPTIAFLIAVLGLAILSVRSAAEHHGPPIERDVMRRRRVAMAGAVPFRLVVAAMLSLTASGHAAAQLYDYPGDYAGRFDGVDAGPKPQLKERGKMKSAPAGTTQFNPETLSRTIQQKSGSSGAGDPDRPYIPGPLSNPKSTPPSTK